MLATNALPQEFNTLKPQYNLIEKLGKNKKLEKNISLPDLLVFCLKCY